MYRSSQSVTFTSCNVVVLRCIILYCWLIGVLKTVLPSLPSPSPSHTLGYQLNRHLLSMFLCWSSQRAKFIATSSMYPSRPHGPVSMSVVALWSSGFPVLLLLSVHYLSSSLQHPTFLPPPPPFPAHWGGAYITVTTFCRQLFVLSN